MCRHAHLTRIPGWGNTVCNLPAKYLAIPNSNRVVEHPSAILHRCGETIPAKTASKAPTYVCSDGCAVRRGLVFSHTLHTLDSKPRAKPVIGSPPNLQSGLPFSSWPARWAAGSAQCFVLAEVAATVCGSVVRTRYAASTKGQPTFLNLDEPYPNQIFTIVVWGSNRSKFSAPETDYKGKRICIAGKITEYRGVPEIVADDPQQIKVDSETR